MKDWSGKNLCFECAKQVGANIEIGWKHKGRCHRCHSEQTLFRVTAVPVPSSSGEHCPECAHPEGTHAASCRRSELAVLRTEREELVRVLEQFEMYDPERPLADQLRQILQSRETRKNGPDGDG